MPEAALIPIEPLLRRCTAQILETMFFTAVCGNSPPKGRFDEDFINAAVRFRGPVHGEMRVSLSSAAAAQLASDFCGAESEVGGDVIDSTVRELTNMLCGTLVSQMEPTQLFTLSCPKRIDARLSPGGSTQCFELMDGGVLLVSVRLD